MRIILKNLTIKEAFRAEIEEWVGYIVRHLPGFIGFALRYVAYRPFFKKIDSMPYIYPGVRFVFMGNISLGKRVVVNSNTYIYGKGGVTISDSVLISPNCTLSAGNHNYVLPGDMIEKPSTIEKIYIGRDSWIGANSVITGDVTIREGSIIGAGSVVTKDTEPFSINAGVPSKKIGSRRTN